MISYFSYNKTN